KLTYFTTLFACLSTVLYGQNIIDIDARFDIPHKTIKMVQTISYQNTSKDTLKIIFLNDWNHSYSTKKTPLAQRFAEEYNTKFHFAKSEERGFTTIISIKD